MSLSPSLLDVDGPYDPFRRFARDLSFLLPLAAGGKKIQIFCGTRELMNNTGVCCPSLSSFNSVPYYYPYISSAVLHPLPNVSSTIYFTFAAAWFKRMFREMGREDITVAKLCGTNSNKETVMEGFGSGRSVNTA